jgi:hypothetical protein
MDLVPYVARLHRDLRVAAEPGGEEMLALAERLAAGMESSIRLVLLDALVEAAGEITRGLAPGSVEVRLRGRDVDFAVSGPAGASSQAAPSPAGAPTPDAGPDDVDEDGGTARLSLRLPERLKPKVELAAEAAGLSVNAWLVRSVTALVENSPQHPPAPPTVSTGQRQTGWVR